LQQNQCFAGLKRRRCQKREEGGEPLGVPAVAY
jgi:hypothetical protein